MVVNPRVHRWSRSRSIGWEACLSVPDYAALVVRPKRIDVEYITCNDEAELMESMSGVLSGSMARVFLHELDHLDGVLYTERMIPSSFTHTSLLDKHVMVDGIQHAEAALAAGLISEISAGTGSGNGRD